MNDVTRAFQRAAFRLEETAARLDTVVAETIAMQSRHDDLTKRMVDLVKSREQNWDATARSALNSLSGKHSLQHRKLERQNDALAKALSAYREDRAAFDTLSDQYADRLVEQKALSRDRQRREAAMMRAYQGLMHDFWPGKGKQYPGAADFKTPETSHSYIALDIPRFLNQLIHLDGMLSTDPDFADDSRRYRPVSFLEVGCAHGRNILLARNSGLVLFESLSGFDFNPAMIEGGQKGLGLGDEIFVADALDFDYSGYDVVYAFRTFSDTEMQHRHEERIAKTMDSGAYYLAPHSLDLALYPELQHVGDKTEIWKKTG